MSTVNPANFDEFLWGDCKLPVRRHEGDFTHQAVSDALATVKLNASPPKDLYVGLVATEKQSLAAVKIDGKNEILNAPRHEGVIAVIKKLAAFLEELFPQKS